MGDADHLVVDEADAYLRGVTLGDRLGRFLVGELEPLIGYCQERGADEREHVLLPTARLLRRAADRLENGLDDLA